MEEETLERVKPNGEGVRGIIEELKKNESGGEGGKEVVQGVLMFFVERRLEEEGGGSENESENEVNVRVHDRMLYTAPGEDPATGSANIA